MSSFIMFDIFLMGLKDAFGKPLPSSQEVKYGKSCDTILAFLTLFWNCCVWTVALISVICSLFNHPSSCAAYCPPCLLKQIFYRFLSLLQFQYFFL